MKIPLSRLPLNTQNFFTKYKNFTEKNGDDYFVDIEVYMRLLHSTHIDKVYHNMDIDPVHHLGWICRALQTISEICGCFLSFDNFNLRIWMQSVEDPTSIKVVYEGSIPQEYFELCNLLDSLWGIKIEHPQFFRIGAILNTTSNVVNSDGNAQDSRYNNQKIVIHLLIDIPTKDKIKESLDYLKSLDMDDISDPIDIQTSRAIICKLGYREITPMIIEKSAQQYHNGIVDKLNDDVCGAKLHIIKTDGKYLFSLELIMQEGNNIHTEHFDINHIKL